MREAALPIMLEDDEPVLALAGEGDRSAQAAMVDHVIACANAGQIPVGVALGAAEVFARMAAADGSIVHRRKLSGVLLWQAENLWNSGYYERSRIYQVEAVEGMSRLADDGDEHAAAALSRYAGAFDPSILQLASEMARAIDSAAETGNPDPTTLH